MSYVSTSEVTSSVGSVVGTCKFVLNARVRPSHHTCSCSYALSQESKVFLRFSFSEHVSYGFSLISLGTRGNESLSTLRWFVR